MSRSIDCRHHVHYAPSQDAEEQLNELEAIESIYPECFRKACDAECFHGATEFSNFLVACRACLIAVVLTPLWFW